MIESETDVCERGDEGFFLTLPLILSLSPSLPTAGLVSTAKYEMSDRETITIETARVNVSGLG